jgi:pimeloyl-ACP methyl ester carboxylesterase
MFIPAERRHVETKLGRLAYSERGRGPAALLVHGVLLSGDLWHGVVDGVADIRRCICPDLLAHGATEEHRDADLSFVGQAAALVELLDALGLDQVDLVGNDSGGGIAQILAASHPHRIRSLALTNCDTHDGWPPEPFLSTVELFTGPSGPAVLRALASDPEAARRALAIGLEHADRLEPDLLRSFFEPLVRSDARIDALVRMFRAFDCRDTVNVEPLLRRLDVPALVVWGSADPFFELHWAHWLRDTLPDVRRLVEIPRGKLFLPLDRPTELAAELRRHWVASALPAALPAAS